MREQNRLADANAAYYYRRTAELREKRPTETLWQRKRLEVENVFWGCVAGYGTEIWWIIGWSILIDLLFTLVYATSGPVERATPPAREHDFTFKLRVLDFSWMYMGTARNTVPEESTARFRGALRKFWNSFRLSSVILLKVGFRDSTVTGHWGPISLQYVVWVEWFLGLYLIAALVITLTNTSPLLNSLLTGVF